MENLYHANADVNLMVENEIQIKTWIMIDASVKIQKNIISVKKIIFGILLNVVAKMSNI